jgi:hypothetical protein
MGYPSMNFAMVQIRMRPEWASVIDFQTRFPGALGN